MSIACFIPPSHWDADTERKEVCLVHTGTRSPEKGVCYVGSTEQMLVRVFCIFNDLFDIKYSLFLNVV